MITQDYNQVYKNQTIRLTQADHFKLRYIANWEGRSAGRQAVYWLRKCIRDFETEYGEIRVPQA